MTKVSKTRQSVLNENNLDAKELAGNIYNNFSQKNEAKVLRKRKK